MKKLIFVGVLCASIFGAASAFAETEEPLTESEEIYLGFTQEAAPLGDNPDGEPEAIVYASAKDASPDTGVESAAAVAGAAIAAGAVMMIASKKKHN